MASTTTSGRSRCRKCIGPNDVWAVEHLLVDGPLVASMEAAGVDLTPAERAAAARYLDRVIEAIRSYAESRDR